MSWTVLIARNTRQETRVREGTSVPSAHISTCSHTHPAACAFPFTDRLTSSTNLHPRQNPAHQHGPQKTVLGEVAAGTSTTHRVLRPGEGTAIVVPGRTGDLSVTNCVLPHPHRRCHGHRGLLLAQTHVSLHTTLDAGSHFRREITTRPHHPRPLRP